MMIICGEMIGPRGAPKEVFDTLSWPPPSGVLWYVFRIHRSSSHFRELCTDRRGYAEEQVDKYGILDIEYQGPLLIESLRQLGENNERENF